MSSKPEVMTAPWDFLGEFLLSTKKKLDHALADLPSSRVSYLEVVLYEREGDEPPQAQFNLSLGEPGRGFCPEIEPDEEPEEEATGDKPVEKPISSAASQSEYYRTPAPEIIQEYLVDFRNDLSDMPQVEGFSVGLRALVTTNPTECCGSCCEYKLFAGWRIKEYYTNAKGKCRSRWTKTPC